MIFSVELPRRQFALTERILVIIFSIDGGGVGGVGVGGHVHGLCDCGDGGVFHLA